MRPLSALALGATLLAGCGGDAILGDDDDTPTEPTPAPTPPAASGAIEAAAWWGEVLFGTGVEVGRCLAVQTDDAVALGLCDVGSGRGFTRQDDTLRRGDACLDGGGDAARMEPCDGGDDQRWIHDELGRLRTLVGGEWGCLHAGDRTRFPDVRTCDDDLDPAQRFAVEHRSDPVPVSDLVADVPTLQVPVALDPVGAVGRRATPLLLGASGRPVVVGGTAGEGRVAAFGSRRALRGTDPTDGWGTLWTNILQWVGDDADPVVALAPGVEGAAWLRNLGATVTEDVDVATSSMAGVDVFVPGDGDGGVDPAALEATLEFLRGGGGLLLARGAVDEGFSAVHAPDESWVAAAATPAGIAWTRSDTGAAATEVDLTADPSPSDFLRLTSALETAARAEQGLEELDLTTWQALRVESAAAATASADVPPHSRLALATDALRRELRGLEISPDDPLQFSSGQLPDLVLRGDYVLTGGLQPGDARVHESAEHHPGLLPEGAEPGAATARIDTFSPLGPTRRSTGLFAPAGGTITVSVPSTAVEAGLRLRIGDAFVDTMPEVGDADSTARFPRVWTGRRLDDTEVSVVTAFGGLIQVDVPEGDGLGPVTLELDGVVEAPRFVLGDTTDADWVGGLRDAPGPRGELGSDRFILSAPAETLALLETPEALAEQFDAMVEAHEAFVGLREADRIEREALPHRLVADPRATTGLQSGRPLEMAEAWTRGLVFVDLQLGNEALFAVLRDLGTTYRRDVWTPGPWRTAMSTLAATYAFEQSTGLPFSEAWQGNLNNVSRQLRRSEWLEGEASGWDADAETTLELFLVLQEEYDWAPLQAVIADLRALPGDERPGDDAAKLHAWIVGISTEVGADVAGLFQAWRFPVAEATLEATESLPEWSAWPRIEPPDEPDEEPDPG